MEMSECAGSHHRLEGESPLTDFARRHIWILH